MSKRLEEIRKREDELFSTWSKEEQKEIALNFLIEHSSFLIEQAERVQELEKENTGLKQDLKDVSNRMEWVTNV